MPFTVIGWNQSPTGAGAYENIQGAKDQHVKVVGDRVYVPTLNKLVFASVRGCLYRGRIKSPSLRRLAYLHINPSENISISDLYPHPPFVMYQGESPLPLVVGEGLEVEVWGAGGDDFYSAIVGLSDAPLSPVRGEIWTVKATATIPMVEGEWGNSEIAFEQTLPVGKYQIVGALCSAEEASAFRFVPIGSMYRPGGPALIHNQLDMPSMFRKGGMGVWCEFDSVTPPSVDALGLTEGDEAVVLYLDIIKIA